MPSRKPQRTFEVAYEDYPFESHWLRWKSAWLHYVDEGGSRFPVVLLHGNPTWSYLYREVIRQISGDWRVIAFDYPGFGFSGMPLRYGFTPQEHAEAVEALLERLGLAEFVLVAHDWGGPIGFAVASQAPTALKGLVLANTWCWPAGGIVRLFSLFWGSPVGRYLIVRHNLFVRLLLPMGIYHAEPRSRPRLRGYRQPFELPERRYCSYVFARHLRKSKAWLERLEKESSLLADKPARLVWGMRDPGFGWESVIRRWHALLPNAGVCRLTDASHFVPEDRPDAIADAIRQVGAEAGP